MKKDLATRLKFSYNNAMTETTTRQTIQGKISRILAVAASTFLGCTGIAMILTFAGLLPFAFFLALPVTAVLLFAASDKFFDYSLGIN